MVQVKSLSLHFEFQRRSKRRDEKDRAKLLIQWTDLFLFAAPKRDEIRMKRGRGNRGCKKRMKSTFM